MRRGSPVISFRERLSRRQILRVAAALPLASAAGLGTTPAMSAGPSRVRPGMADWPDAAGWERLRRAVGGRLLPVRSPLRDCADGTAPPSCKELFRSLRNPYFLGDEPGLTQTLGWVDAWTSSPSAFAVAAESAADVAAAIDFARTRHLRLAVKGGGHSYQGTSNAADSLLVWTRRMNSVVLHDAFVPQGCEADPAPAVTIGAGALWGPVYDAVTTHGGHYVQGGGCLTVGVAGLVQSGGFGSFSRAYGLAAASLLEAEIVTADGAVRTVNACNEPDLFWAIRGGGGGTFGVLTRLTLATHPLPATFGAVSASVRARSPQAFHRLIADMLQFYSEHLHNPHWGEQIAFRPNDTLSIALLFQGLEEDAVRRLWQPFFDRLTASPGDFVLESPPVVLAVPARRLWDPAFLRRMPGLVAADDRPGAPPDNIFWAGDGSQAGQVLHAYQSAWLPERLLRSGAAATLADALFAASRHWSVSLHLNKGLSAATPAARAASAATAIHPMVRDAFALVIAGAEGPPAYPGVPGHEPDRARARRQAAAVDRAMAAIRGILPEHGSYLGESDFFAADWQALFWGANYRRLREVKETYDPGGLFVVHHGVGSERWSADGFSPRP
ncbi:FAD-binding protein [Allostella sp. ATCC 35155]|nr:FAD-binding protein [Stella sp. ATCC 35155]